MTLALDVDGVLIDPDRGGRGPWTNELHAQFGIDRAEITSVFFQKAWRDVVVGRRPVEDALSEALRDMGRFVDVEAVLSCWLDADNVVVESSIALARSAAQHGCRIVLATDQEHRRAAYLTHQIGSLVPLHAVLYSADIGHLKRDPAFFETASARLGLGVDERSTVVFVDDDATNVDVARRAGWRSIHAARDGSWRAEIRRMLELDS